MAKCSKVKQHIYIIYQKVSETRFRFQNIKVDGLRRNYGTYLGGFLKDGVVYPIEDISFEKVDVVYKGGVTEQPASPAEFGLQYPESNCFGILPTAGCKKSICI